MVTKYFTSFAAILARIGRGPLGTYATEFVCVFIIWVMFLVGAAVFTVRLTSLSVIFFCRIGPHVGLQHTFHNLKWCRGSQKVCAVLETIKAFSWMCWAWTCFLLIASLGNMLVNKHGIGGPVHGRRDDVGTYPQTRENRTTGAPTAVHNQPAAQQQQPQVQQVQQLSTA